MDSIPAFLHLPSVVLINNNNTKRLSQNVNNLSPMNLDQRLSDDQLDSLKFKNSSTSAFALHQSILDGRIKQVNYFLKMGSKVNAKDKYGRTCLILAALSDHEDYGLQVAKLLIKYGADLNIRDLLGRTAVFIACTEKREKLFDYFLDNHSVAIDFRIKDNDGNMLLNHTAIFGSQKMLKKVIEKMKERHIEFDQRNNSGYSALLLAIQNDKFLNAFTLVKEAQSSISIRDNEKYFNAIEWLLNRIEANKELFQGENGNKDAAFISFMNEHLNSTLKCKKVKSKNLNGNYKTWLTGNNQYYHGENSCEHSDNPNYSVEHHKSRFIPLILTPRNTNSLSRQNSMQPRFLPASSVASNSLRDSVKEKSNEDLADLDETTELKELVQKLYEIIYSKMSDAFKFHRQSSSGNEKPNVDNEQVAIKSARTKWRSTSVANKQHDIRHNVQLLQSLNINKETQNQQEVRVKIPYRIDTNIFNLESMRQTPKLIALQPIFKQSTKEAVHSMLDLYDSSAAFTQLDGYPRKTPEFIFKREKSKVKMNKEKSNLISLAKSEPVLSIELKTMNNNKQNKSNFKNNKVRFNI